MSIIKNGKKIAGIYNVNQTNLATVESAGVVKPDGETITITAEGVISAVGSSGSEVEGYIAPGTVIQVSPTDNLQQIFDSLANKICPGQVIICLPEATFETNGTISFLTHNNIDQVVIQGAGVDKTIIKKTGVVGDYEYTFIIANHNNVVMKNLSIEGETTHLTSGLEVADCSSVILEEQVKITNCKQAWLAIYNNASVDIRCSSLVMENPSSQKVSYGVLCSMCSKVIFQMNSSTTLSSANIGMLSEMGGVVSIFYALITKLNISTKYSPSLNAHSGTGWILGTEA